MEDPVTHHYPLRCFKGHSHRVSTDAKRGCEYLYSVYADMEGTGAALLLLNCGRDMRGLERTICQYWTNCV